MTMNRGARRCRKIIGGRIATYGDAVPYARLGGFTMSEGDTTAVRDGVESVRFAIARTVPA
jgi:hypothetical protein